MTLFLDRIDAVPLQNEDFSFEFNSWAAVLVDSLNENLSDIQTAINAFGVPNVAVLTESVTLTIGSPSFTVANGTLYSDGESVVGTGIPADTTILTIVGNTVTLDNNATANGAQTLAFIPWVGVMQNGILLYDTTNNVYVGMQNGALVKFTTTAYP